jgi:hypothetical protein
MLAVGALLLIGLPVALAALAALVVLAMRTRRR